MKIKNTIIFILFGLFNVVTVHCQIIQLHLVDEENNPIEGAYVGILNKDFFSYSDTTGVARVSISDISKQDSLIISHISYKPTKIDVESVIASSDLEKTIRLESDVKILDEIVVNPLNPKKLVEEAIRLIPALYDPTSNSALSVHADVDIFDAKDSTSLIYYKGVLHFSQPNQRNLPLVGKLEGTEKIADDAKDRLYPIRVNRFAAMIPIREQAVIQQFKKYTFDSYQYIEYRGVEAIQIHFRRERKDFTQTGYLIIRKDNKAIVALQYSTQPMKNVMKSTVKGSMCYTDLDSHSVEITYALNSNYLYEFESGLYYVKYTNRRSNTTNSVILSSRLKTVQDLEVEPEIMKPIDKLFIE